MTPPPTVESAEMPPAIDAMDPDGEFNPDDVPPAEGTEGTEQTEPPAEGAEGTEQTEPPAEGTEQTEPPADDTEVSDIRKKRVERMKSNWGKTRSQKKKGCGGFKPTAGMIEAASKGY